MLWTSRFALPVQVNGQIVKRADYATTVVPDGADVPRLSFRASAWNRGSLRSGSRNGYVLSGWIHSSLWLAAWSNSWQSKRTRWDSARLLWNLMSCDAIARTWVYQDKAVAELSLIRTDVAMTGEYTGLLYEKFGAASIDGRPAWGTVTVNPDCSFANSLHIQGVGSTIELRGIFFNEGKDYYAMAVPDPTLPASDFGIKYSFCQGTRIGR